MRLSYGTLNISRVAIVGASLAACTLLLRPPTSAAQQTAARADADVEALSKAGDSRAFGADSARVLVLGFIDFACTTCQLFHIQRGDSLRRAIGNDVRLVYLTLLHPNFLRSFHAAEAANCASVVGGREAYAGMADRLYRNASDWTDAGDPSAVFVRFARDMQIDAVAFEQCRARDLTAPLIVSDMITAGTFSVAGTPDLRLRSARRTGPGRGAPDKWQRFHRAADRSHFASARQGAVTVPPEGTESHRAQAAHSIARCVVVVVSDSRTTATDESGPLAQRLIEAAGHQVLERLLLPNNELDVRSTIEGLLARDDVDVVVLSGGTGLGARDRTVEAVQPLLERELPGFGELFRWISYRDQIGTAAILTRALAGVARDTLVVALPGSKAAVELALSQLVLPELRHVLHEIRR